MILTNFFDKLNKFSLSLLLLLIPLLFLPFSANVLDFPKGILVSILVPLSLIGLLGKKIFEGKLVLRENKALIVAILLVFLSILLSSIFSFLPNISFLNYSPDIIDNFILLFLFLILALVVANSFEKEGEFFPFLFIFIASVALASIINILQVYKIFILPFEFAKFASFNTVGTANSLAILGAALLPLSLVLAFKAKSHFKVILGIISFVLFLNITLTNFRTSWVVLVVGILILFIFGLNREKRITGKPVIFLMIGLILSLFFYFSPIVLPGFPGLSPEVSLNSTSEIHIIKGAFDQGIKNITLGTGPGTFPFAYSQYHSALINQTVFWGTRFLSGSSTVLDWFLTKGLFGGITLLAFYFLIIRSFIGHSKKAVQENTEDFSETKLGLAACVISLIVASFFYPFNLVLYFAFWFSVGGFLLFFSPKLKTINISSSGRMIAMNSVLIIIVVLSLSLFFIQGKKYVAEAQYLKGVEASQSGNIDEAINRINGAITINPSSDTYWRDLSQLYLAKINSISQNSGITLEEKRRLTNLSLVSGVEAINQAIDLSPQNVANWNVRGFFYRNVMAISGSEQIALSSYKKASELEPASPFAFGEIGRVYILMAQSLSQEESQLRETNLNLAIDNLNKAIALKPDYAPAYYLLAVVYDQQGMVEQAILKMEEARLISSQDPGVAFQLGLLYWRTQRFDEAESEFERAVSLNSSYSNAKYMLGLAYDKSGKKEEARQQFEELTGLNPENQQVKDILANIKNGLPALDGISADLPTEELSPTE